MEIETDYVEFTRHDDSIRTCEMCGMPFVAKRDSQRFCSRTCSMRNSQKIRTLSHITVITDERLREMRRCEKNEANKRRERMRTRDDAFARFERENGFAPRFEDNGDKIVEIRGRIC